MKNSGKLDNTILIILADHGNRYTAFRNTIQGIHLLFLFLYNLIQERINVSCNQFKQNLILKLQ